MATRIVISCLVLLGIAACQKKAQPAHPNLGYTVPLSEADWQVQWRGLGALVQPTKATPQVVYMSVTPEPFEFIPAGQTVAQALVAYAHDKIKQTPTFNHQLHPAQIEQPRTKDNVVSVAYQHHYATGPLQVVTWNRLVYCPPYVLLVTGMAEQTVAEKWRSALDALTREVSCGNMLQQK